MSRADARMNVILDEIVNVLKGIDGDPDLYLTRPLKVARFSRNPLAEPFPLLLVRCSKWGPNEPQTGSQHDAEASIEVEVLTKFADTVDDPDRELHRVCSDVISAIEADWDLTNAGVEAFQMHVIDGYEPDRAYNEAGWSRAVIGFRAYWHWVAATP